MVDVNNLETLVPELGNVFRPDEAKLSSLSFFAPGGAFFPPVVGNFAPALFSTIGSSTAIAFDLTDTEVISYVMLVIEFPELNTFDVVYTSGSGFSSSYSVNSTVTPISGGVHFSIRPNGGWPGSPFLRISAIDSFESSTDISITYEWTVTSPATPAPPVISNILPAPGTPIGSFETLQLDVTDESGLRRVLLVAGYSNGDYDIVHDGDMFYQKYSLYSTISTITGGKRYRILKNTGWPSSPTIKVFAFDVTGQENT